MCQHAIVAITGKGELVCGDCGEIIPTTLDRVEKLHLDGRITNEIYKQYCTMWRNSVFRFSNVCQEYEEKGRMVTCSR